MNDVQHYCPYCGEPIELQLDAGDADTQYIEDCPVCCRPIQVQLLHDEDGTAQLSLRSEND